MCLRNRIFGASGHRSPNWILGCVFSKALFPGRRIFSPSVRAFLLMQMHSEPGEHHSQGLPEAQPLRMVGELPCPKPQGTISKEREKRLPHSSGDETTAVLRHQNARPPRLVVPTSLVSECLVFSSIFIKQRLSSLSYTFRDVFISGSSHTGNIPFFRLFPISPKKENSGTNIDCLQIKPE